MLTLCSKHRVHAAQEEAKQFQLASREAYQRCSDDIQDHLRSLNESREDLKEKVQDVETLLAQEHRHRSEIGPELFRTLEACQFGSFLFLLSESDIDHLQLPSETRG